MVRYYILPNADHLTEDELNFELTLRNVQVEPDAKLEDKTRALRYKYKTERVDPKLYDTGLPICEEAKNLENVVKALKKSLRETFDYVIVSRLRHYLIRLASANAENEEEKQLKSTCCKGIEEILRVFKQRVTYDPEHSNDETDFDLGDGAKALKNSWRNPNPDAQVQTANLNRGSKNWIDEKTRTGTRPKDMFETAKKRKDRVYKTVDEQRQKLGGEDELNYEKYSSKKVTERPKSEGDLSFQKHSNKSSRRSEEETRRRRNRKNSTTESSDLAESETTEYKRKRVNKETISRSRGRYSSVSSSGSYTEQEEQESRNRRGYFRSSHTPQRHYRGYREEYNRMSRSRVENWDIMFSGDTKSMQVEDFLNRVKKLAKHERVNKMELLDKIHYKLKGEASDWWFTREDHCTTWEKFESEIRFRFGNPNRDRGIRSQLRELRQKRGETFVAFVTEIEKLNQCLKRPHSSRTIFEIVWENMRPHYRSKLATKRVRDLEHLLDLNHRIDATDPNLYRSSQNSRNDVYNINSHVYSNSEEDYSSTEEFAINALQRKLKISRDSQKPIVSTHTQKPHTTDLATVKCWNCQKTGHHWRTCKEPKLIFCYACGNLGRTTKTCERNHPQVVITKPNSTNTQSLN